MTVGTSAGEMAEKALERAHITDNPLHYCIWQVDTATSGEGGVVCVCVCVCACVRACVCVAAAHRDRNAGSII